ncbi:terpene synthase family protein [Streptomyces sp. NBC_01167]|uniref:terpene synthase family protein n=1 Tax=Streptomyces sp. NBC_01167 TaxID=2903756 RepID=UPI00386662BA|nr:terpene synthase family protein [Streptomyces sp. NBC_01167]
MTTLVEVPDFALPFPPSKHPAAAQANTEAAQWAVDRQLVQQTALDGFAGIGFGDLTARVLPAAAYADVLLLAQWMAWSFVLDDQHDHLIRIGRLEPWQPFRAAIAAHTGGDRTTSAVTYTHPLTQGFQELADRITPRLPQATARRWQRHVREMMASLDQEAANRMAPHPPTVTEYILTRRHSSQLPAMMDMSEAMLGLEVPPVVYASPTFQELLWSTIDVISWTNDVFSLAKEAACGDTNNIVVLLAQRDGLDIAEAVQATKTRITRRVQEFLTAEQRLPATLDTLDVCTPEARNAALQCGAHYRDWMIGADHWQRHDCTRYRDQRWADGLEALYTLPDMFVTTEGQR